MSQAKELQTKCSNPSKNASYVCQSDKQTNTSLGDYSSNGSLGDYSENLTK